MKMKLFYFIISFMLMFFTSNFDIQDKRPVFTDNPNTVFLLGNNSEGTREYSFSKPDKIEPLTRNETIYALPVFLEKEEIIKEEESEEHFSHFKSEDLLSYTILERYRYRLLLI